MATFEGRDSSTTARNSYTLRLVVNEDSYNVSENYSSVSWALYLISTGYNFSTWSFPISANVDGEVYNSSEYRSIGRNDTLTIGSGSKTIYHNSDGKKRIACSATCRATGANYLPGNIDIYGEIDLTNIPRFTQVYASVPSTGLNTINVNWSTDNNVEAIDYRLDGGDWVRVEDEVNKSSGSFTISGLPPKTYYNIEVNCKRRDSHQWSSWDNKQGYTGGTTKDIARVTSASNFDLGNNASITVTNPSGNTIQYFVETLTSKGGSQELTVVNPTSTSSGSISIPFTDSQLKTIYSKMGKTDSSVITKYSKVYIRLGIATCKSGQSSASYWDWKDVVCTQTGNIKTGWVNKSGTNKHGKIWIKKSGLWKRAIVWINKNGVWQRGC